MKRGSLVLLVALLVASCSPGSPRPVDIDRHNDLCAFCRMAISTTSTSAQLAAPGEEPRSFDDLGCLAGYLAERPSLHPRAVAYVVDHGSGAWVEAGKALYTRVPGFETPMGSNLVAHADEASRAVDPVAAGLPALGALEVFEPDSLPGGAE